MISEKSRDVMERGEAIYRAKLQATLEASHPNKFLAIEPDSGDYFFGDTFSEAIQAAQKAHPGRISYTLRIGHPAAPAARALLSLRIRPHEHGDAAEVVVWIDTAFDGELVVPAAQVRSLGLPQASTCQAILADGNTVTLETYSCSVDWFGAQRRIEVVTSDARLPLLGTALLRGHKLSIDYRSGEVTLE